MFTTKKLARSAVLLALALVFQNLRLIPGFAQWPQNVFVIGSLVNLVLFFAVQFAGLDGAAIIALITPVVAFLQGHIKFAPLMPLIMAGNLALCIIFYYVMKVNKYAAVALSSVIKWLLLFYGSRLVAGYVLNLSGPQFDALVAGFNVPQLVTALIGGFLFIIIMPAFKKFNID